MASPRTDGMETGTVIVLVLLGLAAVRFVFIALGAVLVLRPASWCPACLRSETLPVRRGWLRPLARWVEWRWCPGCGWEGPGRAVG